MGNPINPAMDRLLFTTDIEEVYRLVTSDEHWVVHGAQEKDGKHEWWLGRINKDLVKDLPSFIWLYEDDTLTTMRRLVDNGAVVDPPFLLERLGIR